MKSQRTLFPSKRRNSPANDLTNYVIKSGFYEGFKLWRNFNGAVYNVKRKCYMKNPMHRKGVFDVIGFRKKDGKHVEIEIKIGKDKISEFQQEHWNDLKSGGCISAVVKEQKDVDEFFLQYSVK